jgi:hypothetical protein
MTRWHQTLEKRWKTMPVYQQILMIANEMNRAENLKNDLKEYKNALERALELMDFSIDAIQNRPMLREFLRARELVAALYVGRPLSPLPVVQNGFVQLSPEAWCYLHGKKCFRGETK